MMFAAVSLWFLCGGIVATSDKFTSLFGAVISAISFGAGDGAAADSRLLAKGKADCRSPQVYRRSGAGHEGKTRAAWTCLCPCPAGP